MSVNTHLSTISAYPGVQNGWEHCHYILHSYLQLEQQLPWPPDPNKDHCQFLPFYSKNLKPGFLFPSELETFDAASCFWIRPWKMFEVTTCNRKVASIRQIKTRFMKITVLSFHSWSIKNWNGKERCKLLLDWVFVLFWIGCVLIWSHDELKKGGCPLGLGAGVFWCRILKGSQSGVSVWQHTLVGAR